MDGSCKLALNLFTVCLESGSRYISTVGHLSSYNQITATYSPYSQQDAEGSTNGRLIAQWGLVKCISLSDIDINWFPVRACVCVRVCVRVWEVKSRLSVSLALEMHGCPHDCLRIHPDVSGPAQPAALE